MENIPVQKIARMLYILVLIALVCNVIALYLVPTAVLLGGQGPSDDFWLPNGFQVYMGNLTFAGEDDIVMAAVAGSAGTMVNICAFVVLFRVLAGLLPEGTPPLLAGVLEMVTGVAGLQPGREGFVSAAALTAWGGLSVHCQGLSSILPAGLTAKWHWAGKGVQAGIAAALAAGVSTLL